MNRNNIMKQAKVAVFALVLLSGMIKADFALADSGADFAGTLEQVQSSYESNGYTCSTSNENDGVNFYTYLYCYKVIPASYTGTLLTSYAVRGNYNPPANSGGLVYSEYQWVAGSPYLYLHNTPGGPVSVSLDSDLDVFKPEYSFTSPNTWLLDSSSAGDLTLERKPVDHLFYRLVIDDIKLSRHGRNFSSKAELISYLKTSDFLDQLGLSPTEAANSLKTIVEDVTTAADSPYYYLTVLDDESVNDISQLHITPAPEQLIRSYFVVYPTPVPVKTSGDFIFPAKKTIGTEYTAKETGELLLEADTFVNFK